MLFKIHADPNSIDATTPSVMWHVSDGAMLEGAFDALRNAMRLPKSATVSDYYLSKYRSDGSAGDTLPWSTHAGRVLVLPGEMIYLARHQSVLDGTPDRVPQQRPAPTQRHKPHGAVPDLGDDDPITVTITPAPWYALLGGEQHAGSAATSPSGLHMAPRTSLTPNRPVLWDSEPSIHPNAAQQPSVPLSPPLPQQRVPAAVTPHYKVHVPSPVQTSSGQRRSDLAPSESPVVVRSAATSSPSPAAALGDCRQCGVALKGRHCHMCGARQM
eukprot:PhM_4_TR16959/c0_g1_i1/m.74493